MNGYWLINDKIVELEKVASVCAQKKAVVLKVAIGSCGGKGVHFLESPQMSEELDRLNNSIQNDIIIQDVIHQHDALSALNVSSVNTIRVLSLLRKSGVKICSVVLRMGIGDSRVDNASSGGITCGVREDGTLKSIAYNKKGESFTCHPTTKASFEGVTIPAYDEMIEATRELALRLPMFRMISWDWTVDEDSKPVLIEANLFNGELDFHQLNNGPIFGEDTQEILNEVFSSTK